MGRKAAGFDLDQVITSGQVDFGRGAVIDLELRLRVPDTGALLRWLLGLGDNVEVVAPAGLRRVMGEQALKMARHYARLSVVGEDPEDRPGPEPDSSMTAGSPPP